MLVLTEDETATLFAKVTGPRDCDACLENRRYVRLDKANAYHKRFLVIRA
jgi:hypothetical protein